MLAQVIDIGSMHSRHCSVISGQSIALVFLGVNRDESKDCRAKVAVY